MSYVSEDASLNCRVTCQNRLLIQLKQNTSRD